MVQFGTLIKKLAAKAGVKSDDPKLVELLSVNAQIPDDIASALESLVPVGTDTLTLEAARNHPELLKHFNAKIFNGMDAKIFTLAEEYGLSDSDMDELKAEKNSYEKLKLLNAKVSEKIEKKYSGKQADKQALLDEIKRLNNEVLDVKEGAKREHQTIKSQAEADVVNYAIDSYLASKPFANKDIPLDVNVMTAKTLINKVLADKKAKIVRKGSELKLVNSDDNALEHFENNKVISFRDLADSVLANNKLLQVSDPAAKNGTGNKFSKPANSGPTGPDNSKVLNAYQKHLSDLGVTG